MTLEEIGKRARAARKWTAGLSGKAKDEILLAAADALVADADQILAANSEDMQAAKARGMSLALLDRLELTPERIGQIAEGIRQVAGLDDPVGEVLEMKQRPNGLLVGRKRVPLGTVGVIYEARPNVTADVFALTFKAGNAVILKGGKDAARSNQAMVEVLQKVLREKGGNADAVQLIMDNSHETTSQFMKMRDYVDVLIPRGGKGLIQAAVNNATVPVIETGTGNCHAYVDRSADLDKAVNIIVNGKTQRIGVCNALESLVVHVDRLEDVLPVLEQRLADWNVELRADDRAARYLKNSVAAREEDWGTEYLDYILSIKTVDSLDEAIDHINTYSTGHSETIITEEYSSAKKFLEQVDSAAVYANASTRFTDGFEFGFGAEIGISTQKLHARGPMGLEALTTTKFIILGDGQVR